MGTAMSIYDFFISTRNEEKHMASWPHRSIEITRYVGTGTQFMERIG